MTTLANKTLEQAIAATALAAQGQKTLGRQVEAPTDVSGEKQIHAGWIASFAAACWLPLGMWIWFLAVVQRAGPEERAGLGMLAVYVILIAGVAGLLVGCVGVGMLGYRRKGAGRVVLQAGTAAAFLPGGFFLVVQLLNGLHVF